MVCDICSKHNECTKIIGFKDCDIPSCYLPLGLLTLSDMNNTNMDDIVYFVPMMYTPEARTKYRYIIISMTYEKSLLCTGEIFKDKSSAKLYANAMNAYRSKYF